MYPFVNNSQIYSVHKIFKFHSQVLWLRILNSLNRAELAAKTVLKPFCEGRGARDFSQKWGSNDAHATESIKLTSGGFGLRKYCNRQPTQECRSLSAPVPFTALRSIQEQSGVDGRACTVPHFPTNTAPPNKCSTREASLE